MKKFVFISLVLVLMLSMVFAALKDVPANHWAAPAINSLASKGIIAGYPDGTYRGKAFITRYQMAVVLDKAVNYLESPLASVQEKLKNLTNTVLTLNDYNSFLNTQQMQMQDKMASMAATITKLQNTIAGIEGFNNDISFLYKKLGIVSDKLENTASTSDLNEVKATLNAVFKTVSINNQQTNDSITGLSNIVYSNKDKLMGISEKVVDLEKTVSGLNYSNDLDLIYSKLAALKELQFDQVKDIKDLQNKVESLQTLDADLTNLQASVKNVNSDLTKLSSSVSENGKTAKSASSMAMMALVVGIVGIALGAYAAFK